MIDERTKEDDGDVVQIKLCQTCGTKWEFTKGTKEITNARIMECPLCTDWISDDLLSFERSEVRRVME